MSCINQANAANAFKQLCENSDRTVRNYLRQKEYSAIDIDDVKPAMMSDDDDNNDENHRIDDLEESNFKADKDKNCDKAMRISDKAVIVEISDTVDRTDVKDDETTKCKLRDDNLKIKKNEDNTNCDDNDEIVGDSHVCNVCKKLFKDARTLKRHFKIHK